MVEGGCVEKSKHDSVIENLGFLIDELMDSAKCCSTERGAAGVTFRQTIPPKNALELFAGNTVSDAESLTNLDHQGFLRAQRAHAILCTCAHRYIHIHDRCFGLGCRSQVFPAASRYLFSHGRVKIFQVHPATSITFSSFAYGWHQATITHPGARAQYSSGSAFDPVTHSVAELVW